MGFPLKSKLLAGEQKAAEYCSSPRMKSASKHRLTVVKQQASRESVSADAGRVTSGQWLLGSLKNEETGAHSTCSCRVGETFGGSPATRSLRVASWVKVTLMRKSMARFTLVALQTGPTGGNSLEKKDSLGNLRFPGRTESPLIRDPTDSGEI